jgi:two-component system, cell cycle sensor histidine kinase and response regulator CckA
MAKTKILIVEDNPIVAEDLKRKLINLSYEVTATTYSGNEALESVKDKKPDIVLMDIRLGDGMNGIDVATILKKDHNISIIYVTAHSDDDTIYRAKQTQPYGYIVKPFDDNELKSTIEIAVYKQQADRQIIESKQWFQTTLNSIGDGVIATDEKGNITFMNPIAVKFTGWDENEAVGKPIEEVFNIINEGTRKKVENPVNKVLKEGIIIGLANHTLLISRDSSEIPIKDSGAPIKLSGSKNLGVVLVFQDDSKNKRAEERIKKSHEIIKQKNIISTAINNLFRQTINCKSSFEVAKVCLSIAEEATKSQFGSIAEVNKNNRFDTLALSNPGWEQCKMAELDPSAIQDMEMRGLWVAALKSEHGLIFNDPSNSPLSVGIPNGHPPLTSFLGMPFRHKKFNGMIGIANKDGGYTEADREIIEALALSFAEVINSKRAEEALRESKNRLRDITHSMADWIWEVDRKGKYTYVSDTVKNILGYSAEELLGKTPFELMPAKERDKTREIFFQITSKSNPIVDLENWNLTKDGTKVCLLTNGVPVIDANGESQGYRGVDKDITTQRMLEKEKTEVEAQLRQAQKMESVGRLAGGVAHDYNNALTAIMGYTELALINADPKGPLHQDLNEVLKASRHAKDITRQLLAFARKQTIAPKVLDLNTNIESMLKMIRRLIGEDIDLVWFPGKSLWNVKMDPSQIDQILANLCVNAKDAIAGVGRITIETSQIVLDEAYCAGHRGFVPGEFVTMSISDDGCGMDKEIQDNIFEPFFTTKDIEKGTGLGLSTIYGIVKQNNGFINVYSEPDKGTTIKIYLPRHDDTAIESKKERADEIPQGHGETILLVEDDISILKLIQKILNRLGYKVLAANSPKRAIKLAKNHNSEIHLLVTDVIMPEMNGFEMANSLQSLYPNLKRIFMSGYTANAIAHHGVLDEGIDFIQKPCSQIDLAKIVRKVLDKNNN